MLFKGSIPALITPMSNGVVDEETFQKLVEFQIEHGSHALVPVGTTGESPTLTYEEHKRVVELCIEVANHKIPVIAGAGSNNTVEAIELVKFASKAGADAALVATPYYNKPNQEGLYQHYKALNDCADIPIFIYNIPSRSIIDMSVETMAKLYQLPNIIGVKDATGDISRVNLQRMAMDEDFIQLSGDDATCLGFNAHGGQGCISVTANIAPALCSQMQEACINGNYAKALEVHNKLIPLHTILFSEPSPAPVKYAASVLGICQEDVRLPIVPVTEATKLKIREALNIAKLI